MAEKRKSIVEDSLMEADQIRKAFEVNAKEILTHAMGSEIEQMVKESLEDDLELDDDNGEATDLELSDDEFGGETEFDLDLDDEGEDNDLDMDLDIDIDDEGEDGEELDLDLDIDADDETLDLDLDDMGGDDVEMVDLTSAGDSEVITVFKKMGPSDEIEVVRSGDTIDIKDTQTNSEYRIEIGGDDTESEIDLDDMDMDDMDMEDDDMDDELESLGEGTIYEIELGEDEDMDYLSDEDMEPESYRRRDRRDRPDGDDDLDPNRNLPKSDMERRNPSNRRNESPRTKSKLKGRKYGNPRGINLPESEKPRISKLLKENTVLKTEMKSGESKVKELTENNDKLVGALKVLRQKLQEVAIFNSNLTYSVRLMTENATTSDEKVKIIKRMDEAKTLKGSKTLYKALVNELGKPSTVIKESVENRLNETKSSGSVNQISESKVYVDPELAKMRKLMDFNYNYNK